MKAHFLKIHLCKMLGFDNTSGQALCSLLISIIISDLC